MKIPKVSLWVLLFLLGATLAHAKMTAFGERVDSSSTPDTPLSSIPEIPLLAPSPAPKSTPQSQNSSSPKPSPSPAKKDSAAKVAKLQTRPKTPSAALPIPTPRPVKLIGKIVMTGQESQPEIHFFLRLPEGHTPAHPTAKGVLAFCTWQHRDESLRAAITNERSALVQYAKKNNLALLTWNTS